MKKRDRKALGAYCRGAADMLELRDWTVWVSVEDPEDPGRPDGQRWAATSESTPGRKRVSLTFAPDVRHWPRESIRSTVAHELIHAHFAPLIDMLRTDLHPYLHDEVFQVFNDGATRWLEFGVDAMADAVAPRLPLIEWPKR